MILGTLSFLAWWPAIAAVVVSERPLAVRVPLFLALAFCPPVSLAVMAASIRKARPISRRKKRSVVERRPIPVEAPVREPMPTRAMRVDRRQRA